MPMEYQTREALNSTWEWFGGISKAPVLRPMSKWVEDEIILPNGPYAGEFYRHRRHPVSRLWFAAIDSGRWSRFAATGPTQNGKTLMCYVVPVLYHLFEMAETVVIGLPSMDMANDKWELDFKPVIESSKFRDLLPVSGEGSRGGQVKRAIRFRNGAVLRFMSAGGSDKKRAGYTSRVIAITETDGMDEPGEASREADKIEQIEARSRAFGKSKRIYLECTVSIELGRIWQEIKSGSDSRIARPCPHCKAWVTPEREHLKGWQTAASEDEAAEQTTWTCPACSEPWTEEHRRESAEKAVLVHRGQEVTPEGEIVGTEPKTQTLGFRWSAIDNPFADAGELGREEWLAKKSKDRENAEKKQRQFVFCLPYEPPDVDMIPLDADEIQQRVERACKRGMVPAWAKYITVGVDTGKRQLHWTAIAASADDSRTSVIEYGRQPVEADRLGVFRALVEGLAAVRKYLEQGWHAQDGTRFVPSQVWIDSGYHEHTDAVYAFCQQASQGDLRGQERYRPTKGYGEGQSRIGRYIAPNHKQADVTSVGRELHLSHVKRNGKVLPGVILVHMNSDHWKSELHQRLSQPLDQPGAMSLYEASDTFGHSEFSSHIVAERQVEKFQPGRGTIVVWERIDRNNHWLDSSYAALAAAVWLGANHTAKKKRLALNEMGK